MVVSAISTKGAGGDMGQVIALRRAMAVIGAQVRKNPAGDQSVKPYIREGIMQKGTTTGYVEYYAARGLCRDATPQFGGCR